MKNRLLVMVTVAGVVSAAVTVLGSNPPVSFTIRMSSLTLSHEQGAPTVAISVDGTVLSADASWTVKRVGYHIWHLSQISWESFYWKVDGKGKTLTRVDGGTFGREGGHRIPVAADVARADGDGFTMAFGAEEGPVIKYDGDRADVVVQVGEVVVSAGPGWEIREVGPLLYHLRHKGWSDTHWRVDVGRGELYEVTDGRFGVAGGDAKLLPFPVNSKVVAQVAKVRRHRTPVAAPATITLRFPSLALRVDPDEATAELLVEGMEVAGAGSWEVRRVGPSRCDLRGSSWKEWFWRVDTDSGQVTEVTGGRFGASGGEESERVARVTDAQEGGFEVVFGRESDPHLVYDPADGGVRVALGEDVISDRSGWRTRQLRPHLFHLRHSSWEGFHWSVSAGSPPRAFKVIGGAFGMALEYVYGGGADVRSETLPFTVEVVPAQ